LYLQVLAVSVERNLFSVGVQQAANNIAHGPVIAVRVGLAVLLVVAADLARAVEGVGLFVVTESNVFLRKKIG
jgi:ABC-type nitrate/sulfonate/bicarbonate transport system permease component